jgi:hypothetical protein
MPLRSPEHLFEIAPARAMALLPILLGWEVDWAVCPHQPQRFEEPVHAEAMLFLEWADYVAGSSEGSFDDMAEAESMIREGLLCLLGKFPELGVALLKVPEVVAT